MHARVPKGFGTCILEFWTIGDNARIHSIVYKRWHDAEDRRPTSAMGTCSPGIRKKASALGSSSCSLSTDRHSDP